MGNGEMPEQDRGQRDGERAEGNRREAAGGFRIRLSDNELRAARTIQDTFQLRSTVAVLGFALRTVAQLLEQGSLAELVAQQQQENARPAREAVNRGDRGGRSERTDRAEQVERAPKPDPFARPSKPAIEIVEPVDEENVVTEAEQVSDSDEINSGENAEPLETTADIEITPEA
jgi:hypothetical protein